MFEPAKATILLVHHQGATESSLLISVTMLMFLFLFLKETFELLGLRSFNEPPG